MFEALTINLPKPVAGLRLVEEPGHEGVAQAPPMPAAVPPTGMTQADEHRISEAMKRQQDDLVQLCQTVNGLAAKLNDLHQQTVAQHRSDIAKLAVEIARKILTHKVNKGEYDIQAIVEEALKRAPTRQNLVVRVNPEDLTTCQQCQQENPGTQFAELDLVADWGIARADCLVETPKGIVKSFVEEHLARIGEALEKAQ